jgi:hypothetical protein
MISGRISTLGSQSDFRVKNELSGLLFFKKHKLHVILPIIMQKNSENG